jgi:lysozyme
MSEDPALKTAVDLIAKFEGFRPRAYLDSTGVWTIGYGSTYLADGSKVTAQTKPMSEPESRDLMSGVVVKTLASVRAMVHAPATDNQCAALTSFAYNLGTRALRTSTLLRLFNEGKTQDAADQFGAWVKAGGHTVEGLVRRRADERALFLSNAPPAASDALKQPGGVPVSGSGEAITADDLNAQVLKRLHTV